MNTLNARRSRQLITAPHTLDFARDSGVSRPAVTPNEGAPVYVWDGAQWKLTRARVSAQGGYAYTSVRVAKISGEF